MFHPTRDLTVCQYVVISGRRDVHDTLHVSSGFFFARPRVGRSNFHDVAHARDHQALGGLGLGWGLLLLFLPLCLSGSGISWHPSWGDSYLSYPVQSGVLGMQPGKCLRE